MSTTTINLPIIDPHASQVRGEPVWALDEWRKHYPLLPAKAALRAFNKRADYLPPDMQAIADSGLSAARYIRNRICTGCQGEGSPLDPRIVGCRVYACPLWPHRHGKDPTRKGNVASLTKARAALRG